MRAGEGHLDQRGEEPAGSGGSWGGGLPGRAQTLFMAGPVLVPSACHFHGSFPEGGAVSAPTPPLFQPCWASSSVPERPAQLQVPPSLRPDALSTVAPGSAPSPAPHPAAPGLCREQPYHVCGRPRGHCAGSPELLWAEHRAEAAALIWAWLPGVPGAQAQDPFMGRGSCCPISGQAWPFPAWPLPGSPPLSPPRTLGPSKNGHMVGPRAQERQFSLHRVPASPSVAGPSQWLLSPICEGSCWVSTPLMPVRARAVPAPGRCSKHGEGRRPLSPPAHAAGAEAHCPGGSFTRWG